MQYDRNKYLEYINNSEEWKLKRHEVFSLKGYRCERCGSSKKINVHHGTYQRLFNEEMTDLFSLCDLCHKEYHLRTRKISIFSTQAFIKNQVFSETKKKIKSKYKKAKKNKKDKSFALFIKRNPERASKVTKLKSLLGHGKITKQDYFSELRKL